MSNRKPNPTQAAGILRRFLKDAGIELQHTAALEAVARISGFTDWQAMAADQKMQAERDAEYPPLLQLEPGNDNSNFVYVANPHNKGAWVAIGNISAYLKPTDEGVVVDLFALGAEDRGSETSTYLHYQEALDALCENLGVEEEMVAAWAKSTHNVDFDKQTPARKSELAKEFAEQQPAAPQQPAPESSEEDDPKQPRYLHGNWDHIFRGKKTETTRIVFDREKHAIVYMEIRDGHQWWPGSHMDIADVQDSLLNANGEALDNPQDWGLEESDTPPQWAAAFVRPWDER